MLQQAEALHAHIERLRSFWPLQDRPLRAGVFIAGSLGIGAAFARSVSVCPPGISSFAFEGKFIGGTGEHGIQLAVGRVKLSIWPEAMTPK